MVLQCSFLDSSVYMLQILMCRFQWKENKNEVGTAPKRLKVAFLIN